MKTLITTLMLLALTFGLAQAGNLSETRTVGNYEVSLGLGSEALVVGSNTATVSIRDSAGKNLTGLPVEIYYFMPSMPAMNTTAKAEQKDDSYTGTIEPSMGGVWEVEVRFQAPGGEKHKATFTFDIK